MADKILIIENDPTLGGVLLTKMQGKGYEAQLVSDGAQGLETMRTWQPNLVLLDTGVPTLNGYELLEAKAKDPSITSIPVIIISNSGQPVEINRAVDLGVSDYMIKTDFNPEEVIGKVEQHLNTKGTPATALANKTILVVEDDTFLSYIVITKLQHHGATVLGARTADEAYEVLKQHRPDLVILDLILGTVSGFEILEAIKKEPNTTTIPVIILSNLNQEEDIVRCKKLGIVDFLVKANVTPEAIVQEIDSFFSKQQPVVPVDSA